MAKKLMIIDDDAEYLKELKKLLETPDLEVSTYSDSVAGLAEIKEHIPDLMLLDVKMPDLTGIQLAALVNLSEEIKDIPMFIISGNVNEEEIKEAMDICNVKKYFAKPVDPKELIREINTVLSQHQTSPCH